MSSLTGQDIKWLQPGWNEFPDRIWDLHSKDKEILQMIEDGHLEFKTETVGKGKKAKTTFLGEGDKEVRLMDMDDEKKIVEIIKGTFNEKLLVRWLDEENRHKVKRALDAQIKSLHPEEKKD